MGVARCELLLAIILAAVAGLTAVISRRWAFAANLNR